MKQKRIGRPVDGSKDVKRQVALILEVLGGLRTPAEAFEDMGVSLQRYYVLEARAIQGMVDALEPRSRGRKSSGAAQVEALKREKKELEQELARVQSLLRTTRRVMGLPSLTQKRKEEARTKPRKRKAAKPRVRAKKAIACLRLGEPVDAVKVTELPPRKAAVAAVG